MMFSFHTKASICWGSVCAAHGEKAEDLESVSSEMLSTWIFSVSETATGHAVLPGTAASLEVSSFHWLVVAVLSSCGCDGWSFACLWRFFFLFLELWYCLMACFTSVAVHWWRVRASCKVKGPSLVRLTPLHTAVLRSSSPISCTTLRRYFWVSFRHWTSVRKKTDKISKCAENLNMLSGDRRVPVCSANDYSPKVKLGGWKWMQRKPVKIGSDFPSGPSKPCTANS